MTPPLRVAVGSTNPVKVNSVRAALTVHFPAAQLIVTGFAVASGVRDQPWGDAETRMGAVNRALACAAAFKAENGKAPDFAVGLEGGVSEELWPWECIAAATEPAVSALPKRAVECFAWLAVLRPGNGKQADDPSTLAQWGFARTGSFVLPQKIVDLMYGSPPMELGDADDAVFSDVNSKQKGGTVAKATRGAIDRTAYYEHAMHLALAPFLHDDTGLYS